MTVRLTTRMPLSVPATRIGLTLWKGSIEDGWIGKPVAPWRWHITYRITSVSPDKRPE